MAEKKTTKKFEQSLKELESIVEKMEDGNLSLDESLACLERGLVLSRTCSETLKQAEQRVSILLEENGNESLKPFVDKTDSESDTEDDGTGASVF